MSLARTFVEGYRRISKKRAPKTVEEWAGWWLLNHLIHEVPKEKLFIPKCIADDIENLISKALEELRQGVAARGQLT